MTTRDTREATMSRAITNDQIDRLRGAGRQLLRESPIFQDFLRTLH